MLILFILFCTSFQITSAGSPLSLENYLDQVRYRQPGFQGASVQAESGLMRSHEGSLLTTPQAFSELQYTREGQVQSVAFLGYDYQRVQKASVGIRQVTDFGLQASLHYDLTTLNLIRPIQLFAASGSQNSFLRTQTTNASTLLEISQNLWSWGQAQRTQKKQLQSQAMAAHHQAQFHIQQIQVQAEIHYWNLAFAQQALSIQKQAFNRVQKIYEWHQHRANLQLAEQAEVLQSKAMLQTRQLEVLAAENQMRSLARTFNLARHQDSDQVPEELISFGQSQNIGAPPPRSKQSQDLQAQEDIKKATQAQAVLAQLKNQPTLELWSHFALNGQPSPYQGGYLPYTELSHAIRDSLSWNRPSLSVGLRFSIPLAWGTLSSTQKGWALEQLAQEHFFEQTRLQQDMNWKNLQDSFQTTLQHFKLSRQLETLQEQKLHQERQRLHQGRTTTYQVLLFEQDFLMSQLGRLKDQVNLLTLLAEMKLFGDSYL